MNSAKVKNIVREMGPLIGLILLFIVISVLNDSFIDPSKLKKPGQTDFHQCTDRLWHDLRHPDGRH